MKAAFKKPRVALFTPLPPCKTGTADYGVSLAEEMEKLVSLSVYEKEPFGFAPESFDSVVYQIGNNPYHTPIYKTALRHPGVVVLHEATVHNLVRSMTLNRGNHGGYLRQVAYEIFGDDLRYAAAKRFPIESPQPQEFLMLRSLVKKSRACIVHSHYAERLVRLKEFRGPIGVVPHGVTLRTIDARRYRQNLKLDVHVPLIGVFGYQRPDKQVWECLLTRISPLALKWNSSLEPRPAMALTVPPATVARLAARSDLAYLGTLSLAHRILPQPRS